VVFVGLLAMVVLAAGALGCGGVSGGIRTQGRDAFVTDRVVEVRIVMKDEDWTSCQVNALAEEYVRADFWFDGELIPDVAVRPKGNSSLKQATSSKSPRFSLKVDFNFFNSARTFRGLKKLNFNNGWSDPTLIRERLAYELFEQMGIPTPRTSHVDLWVNDTHLGVYTMVEQIDKTFLGQHFPKGDGNLYKPEMMVAPLNWTEAELERQHARWGTTGENDLDSSLDVNLGGGKLREIMQALQQDEAGDETVIPKPPNLPPGMPPQDMPQRGIPQPGMPQGQTRDYLELVGLKTNENRPDHSALLHFLDVLNNEPDETFPAEIEKVLDVDEVLRFLAVSTLIVHLDNYLGSGHNYYLYEVDGKFTVIPWDLNMAFGTFNCGIDREGLINFYIDEPTGGPVAQRPLVKRLLSYPPYLDAYHGYLEALLDGPFEINRMTSRIDELADLIRPFVEADELKFFSTMDFERCLSEDIKRATPESGIPPGIPPLSPENLACLKKQFTRATLQELRTRRPSAEELQKLRSCLTREELSVFLQNIFGPAAPPQQLGQLRLGPSAIGLKTFVVERSTSVRQQLDGERLSSSGDGSGNGATSGMCGGGNRRPDNLGEPILSNALIRGCKPASRPSGGFATVGLEEGERAVDFKLKDVHGNEFVLSRLLAEKPVVMIFGSFT
jgi:spore coat protein CotH